MPEVVLRSETDAPRHHEHGRVISSSDFAGVNPGVRHTIEALVAAVDVVGPKTEQQLRHLLTTAFLASNGSVVVMVPTAVDPELAGPHGSRLDSTRHCVHPDASDVFAAPSQHLLSFNAPEHQLSGACRECRGTGIGKQLREHALVARPDRAMRDGAFAIWTPKNYKYVNIQHGTIEGLRGVRGGVCKPGKSTGGWSRRRLTGLDQSQKHPFGRCSDYVKPLEDSAGGVAPIVQR